MDIRTSLRGSVWLASILGVALLADAASARLIVNPNTAKSYSAISFVPGSAQIGARFGFALAVGDFNDDGYEDLAVGIPYQPHAGDTNRLGGAVMVIYGAHDRLGAAEASPVPGLLLYGGIGGPPQHLERFGWSLAVGDFDDDGYDDLAVGAPGYDISAASEGAVYTFSGGSAGISTVADIRWSQAVLLGTPQNSEQFGHALAAGDLNGDGRDDLAIGVPYDQINGVAQGSVAVLYANAGGLAVPGNELWHQDVAGVPGGGESGDRFGWSLSIGNINHFESDDLLIGMPGEAIGSLSQAGAVNVLYGTATGLATSSGAATSTIITQDALSFPDDPSEAGDLFGTVVLIDAYDPYRLHIGAPGEDQDSNGQGVLQTLETSHTGPHLFYGGPNRYGAPGGGIGASIASGLLLQDAGEAYPHGAVLSGEPNFQSGLGALRIAPNGNGEGDPLGTGASYYSNAFGLDPQDDAHFGKSVAVGNFNGRGPDEIVIGTPLWDSCVPFDPPICLPDRGLITVVDDTVFADGFD